jgi:hypothetical protein
MSGAVPEAGSDNGYFHRAPTLGEAVPPIRTDQPPTFAAK